MSKLFDIEYGAGMKMYQQAVDKAEADLISMGLSPSQRPRDAEGNFLERIIIPTNLSTLAFDELTDLQAKLTVQTDYAREQLAIARGERDAAKSAKEFVWAKIRQQKDGLVDDKNDQALFDARYVEASSQYEYFDAKYNILKAMVDGMIQNISTVSRAITALEQRNYVDGHSTHRPFRRSTEDDKPNYGPPNLGVMSKFRAKKST